MRLMLKMLLGLAAALLLGACSISSPAQLIADESAVAPLPDAFTFYPYEPGSYGYVPSKDGSATFVRRGADYVSTNLPDVKGELDVRFAPLGEGLYLLGAKFGETPDVAYGFVRYANSVLAIYLTPNRHTASALARERRHSMPKTRRALGGLTVAADTDAITVRTRSALHYLGRMFAENRLPMAAPAIALIAEDPTAPLPSRLVASGAGWIKVP